MKTTAITASSAALWLAACTAGPAPHPDSALRVSVASLSLASASDVVYDLQVDNGAGQQVVALTGLRSSRYGDGRGAITYVAPCDASRNPHRVSLTLVAIEGLGPDDGWVNPAPPERPVSLIVDCRANGDTPVSFNLTVAREANQGFFDIGVTFDDIFCAAKLDCVDSAGDPLRLLHRADGERDQTAVVAFACTTGAGSDTHIYRTDLRIDCADGARYVVRPTAGQGNLGAQPPGLFQAAIYTGREDFAELDKCYWNAALGLDLSGLGPNCTLSTSATATPTPLASGRLEPGRVWPVVSWTAPLTDATGALACGRAGLDDGSGVVTTGYVSGDALTFTRHLACATGVMSDPAGFSCGATRVAGGEATIEVTQDAAGVVVQVGEAISAPYRLPTGLTAGDCCADPCCE